MTINEKIRDLASTCETDTPVEKYVKLYDLIYHVCEDQNWGDPISFARGKEIHLSGVLGHKVSDTLSGADAFDEDGACEYKTTTTKSIKGTYSGISVFPTWEEQKKYLEEEKLKKYKNHYIARYEGSRIAEAYRLSGDDVYDILLPKLKRKYESIAKKKDPRLSATLTRGNILEYGAKII